MAGRPARQAYRMTTRRRAALRKAQIASARKRKRNKKLKIAGAVGVGVLAVGGAAWAGTAIGNGTDIRSSLKNRKLAMNNARNKMAGVISPDAKEAMMKRNAVSPPPVRWQKMPGGLASLPKSSDPVASAPTPQQAAAENKPKNQTTPRQSTVINLPGQTADTGRQNMENQPMVNRQGQEYGGPKQDVWGAAGDATMPKADDLITSFTGGVATTANLKKALGKYARTQKNLGRPLNLEQKNAMWKYYCRVFGLDPDAKA